MQLAEKQPRTRAEWAAYYGKVRRRIDAPRRVLALSPPVLALPAPEPLVMKKPDYVPQPQRWCPQQAQVSGTYVPPAQNKAYSALQIGVLAAVPRPPPVVELQQASSQAPRWAPPVVTYRCQHTRYVCDYVMRVVCQRYNITREQLVGPNRWQEIVRPRQVAMYLIKQLADHSLPGIGRIFGNRDHTTVICAVRRVEQLRQRVPELDALVCEVLGSFGC